MQIYLKVINMTNPLSYILKSIRMISKKIHKYDWHDYSRIEYMGQQANDFIRKSIIESKDGLLIAKFGTIELNSICCCKRRRAGLKKSDYIDYFRGKGTLFPKDALEYLYNNAGFFPKSLELQEKFTDLVLNDIKDIDILGSYVDQETYLSSELMHCSKIDIYGYCAPFAWVNPWTEVLKDKKVLIVHPFTESIKNQYKNREKLFNDTKVLPQFKELILIKAVQSIAGNGEKTGFKNWFDALEYMENEVDKHDYDIALIGCGAYGMSLAAHCKRKGKIAIHMASWIQMLFGIYGQRWLIDQPEFAHLINEYWVRPLESEKPENVQKVENGAYW